MSIKCQFDKGAPSLKKIIKLTSVAFIVSITTSVGATEFNASFLRVKNKRAVNLDMFSKKGSAPPGSYETTVYLNGDYRLVEWLEVKLTKDGKNSYICLPAEFFSELNLDQSRIPESLSKELASDKPCVFIDEHIKGASSRFDSNISRLDISIPQIYLLRHARGNVSPALWDTGINALSLSYMLNGYHRDSGDYSDQSLYASLNAGVNIYGWYIRQYGSLNWSNNGELSYNSVSANVQRDIKEIRSRVTIGKTNTSGKLFDTVQLNGFKLSSDNRMLPDSQRGYAPEIRGFANTTASVTVKQNNKVIYKTSVSPGDFLINDLYPTGYGGDLDVTVEEADGSSHSFSVPYSSVAELIRPNTSQYSLTLGQYKSSSLYTKPFIFEGTYQHGINNFLTGYTGLQLSEGYVAAQLGFAVGTYVGAISADVTHSVAELAGLTQTGQSYQVKYSKNFIDLGTNVSLAAFKYSTQGYLNYQDAMLLKYGLDDRNGTDLTTLKNRVVLSLNQNLGAPFGNLYLNSSNEQYWNSDETKRQFQFGYSNYYKSISYGVSANRNYDNSGAGYTNFQFNFSFPLGLSSQSGPRVNVLNNRDKDRQYSQQVGISDSFGDSNQYSYGVSASRNSKGDYAGSGNLSYRSQLSSLNASFSKNKGSYSIGAGASGGLILHSGGLTFGAETGNTYALIKAKGAQGAAIQGQVNTRIDAKGYAIISNIMPYKMNTIKIDPKGADGNVEFNNTKNTVVPHAGAIVLSEFNTKVGQALLITSKHKGDAIPFAAVIYDEAARQVGYAGQAGQVFVRVENQIGQLKVQLASEQFCLIDYNLAQLSQKQGIYQFDAECK